MLKVILGTAKKALKKALPHTTDNQWSIWWDWAGRPLGPQGERGGLIASKALKEKEKKSPKKGVRKTYIESVELMLSEG